MSKAFSAYCKIPNLTERLLEHLCIIVYVHEYIQIDNQPDYDMAEYQGTAVSIYYFRNSWNFADKYYSILNASVTNVSVFHADDLDRIQAHNAELRAHTGFSEAYNKLFKKDARWFHEHGMGTDMDEIKIHFVKTDGIDNESKRLYYQGKFSGDSSFIDPMDAYIIAQIKLTAVDLHCQLSLTNTLIADAYSYRRRGDNKISFFLLFTAFECFINEQTKSSNERMRLEEKINSLFSESFEGLSKHEIYTTLMPGYGNYYAMRNKIAHGLQNLSITDNALMNFFIFVLTLMATVEWKAMSFTDIAQRVETTVDSGSGLQL